MPLQKDMLKIQASPCEQGSVELIICRPSINQRRVLEAGELTVETGLIGDHWVKAECHTSHYNNYQHAQISLMNAQVIDSISPDKTRWPLAGDNFIVDIDLSQQNTPAGTQLEIGNAIIEVTEEPHLPCKKFRQRFGQAAFDLLNSEQGRLLNLRGVYARVISPGKVSPGSIIKKLHD